VLLMPRTLNLFGTDSDLSSLAGNVGMLCEFPEDSEWLKAAEHWYGPQEMLGSPDEALSIAFSVVSKLMAALSDIKELPVLSIFEEPLLEQISYAVQAFHLDRWIGLHGFSECRFEGYSPWLDRLRRVRCLSSFSYRLMGDVSFTESGWMRRGAGRLWKARSRPGEVLRRAAPIVSRYASATRTREMAGKAPRGGIWFYSTSYNYTKIGLEYETYFPQPVHFLVEDPTAGGRCLSERGRSFYPLYSWSRASDIPSRVEVRDIAQRIVAAARSVPLSEDEDRLRTVLLKSDWWDQLLQRRLPFLIFHERVLQRWCEAITPEMLVVGNAGWERALLQSRQARNIPSILLQHGVMHWVYAVADQPVTAFLLRGRFFQRVLNDRLRSKTVLCNYPQENGATVEATAKLRGDILFITTPYDVPALFHTAELREILGCLLRVCGNCRRRLVIRVHPLERVSSYHSLVEELQPTSGTQAEVAYSQGPGVEEVLTHSSVAVLFSSTMFLDCLRHGIPIISFGWHWFPNKRHYEEAEIFNFAGSLGHLEELIHKGIAGELRSRHDGLEAFMAPMKPEHISHFLAELWESRVKADGGVQLHSLAAPSAD
jgi:hypothetical protein